MKKQIKLTESQLNNVIKESIKKIINEIGETPDGQYMLGRLAARKQQAANAALNGVDVRGGYLKNAEDANYISTYAKNAMGSNNTSDNGDSETYFKRGKQDQQFVRPGSKGMPSNGSKPGVTTYNPFTKKLKTRRDESKIDRIVKECVNKVLRESRNADGMIIIKTITPEEFYEAKRNGEIDVNGKYNGYLIIKWNGEWYYLETTTGNLCLPE